MDRAKRENSSSTVLGGLRIFPEVGAIQRAAHRVRAAPGGRGASLAEVCREAKPRQGRSGAVAADEVWAMDVVHELRFDGRKIRALTTVDAFARRSPAIDAG